MHAVIFDLDGTLCDIEHRLHFVNGDKKDYQAFNASCVKDIVKPDIKVLLNLYSLGHKIILVSGRDSYFRGETMAWLRGNCIHYDELLMRPEGDTRPDAEIKREMYYRYIVDRYIVKVVVDDRDRVVQMWRDLGLTCLQCQKGDY